MAEKGFREKRLEDFDDVFADIINGLLFHGGERVLESEPEFGMPRPAYIDNKKRNLRSRSWTSEISGRKGRFD